jgi:FkbM family methyltransferase
MKPLREIGKTVIRATLHSFGFEIVRYNILNFFHLKRQQMIRDNKIDLVIDVGANTGIYGREIRSHGYRGRILSFEPLSEAYAGLAEASRDDPAWDCHNLALGDEPGRMEINISENSVSSSFLPMLSRHEQSAPDSVYVGRETVEIATLDSLMPQILKDSDRCWMKVDVQGFEMTMLAGAEETVARCRAIEIELSLQPLYANQPLICDMIGYLAERGFVPVALSPGFADVESGHVLQMNGIFWKNVLDN